ASELMTIAGRLFRSSAPTVGSRATRQTSPRSGSCESVLNNVSVEPFPPFSIRLIRRDQFFGLLFQPAATLYERQPEERTAVDIYGCRLQIHLFFYALLARVHPAGPLAPAGARA